MSTHFHTGSFTLCLLQLRHFATHALWVRCGFSVFTGELLAGRAAAGIPRGYWNFSWVAEDDLSFPNDSIPTSGESGIVSPAQTDRQAQTPLSSKDPLLPIGHDTWHQLSISTHKRLCLAALYHQHWHHHKTGLLWISLLVIHSRPQRKDKFTKESQFFPSMILNWFRSKKCY